MALVIAGDRSGVGKTTVTLALLAFLSRKGDSVQSFKVGPDYIDPMFHASVTGRPCRNLDPVLTSEDYVQSCFTRHSQEVNHALVEGVMGLFDGIHHQGISDFASTAHISRLLNLPVLLVLDCSRISGSVAAIAHGYRCFDPRVKIAGIILNRVGSDRHLELLKNALEPLHLPIFGVLRRQDKIAIPDRHLGLIPPQELAQLDSTFDRLAELATTSFDWNSLLPLLRVPPPLPCLPCLPPSPPLPLPPSPNQDKVKIAIARDRAFNFYYQDNLDILQALGAELIPWSPLEDRGLPEGIQGLYLGGGFPEVFAQQLANNQAAGNSVRLAIQAGMATYAECGGLMYLCKDVIDLTGQTWRMAGILPTTAIMGQSLTLGYRQATALGDSPCLSAGTIIWGHEFHHSQLTHPPCQPLFATRGYQPHAPISYEGWQLAQLHASYLHLHFAGCPSVPQRFLQHCRSFPS